ncbi:hypothetical protein KMI_01g00810 [Encephalitozoon hellem]|uniref:Uncharacterized protein n=1 Tax=Encephalitozoon hellem TaxID=27973 RepID=A0A9Q9CD67_ENCHE|nr:uncharacterized protein EHEL_080185 [Encephalitozoon hellem ATCC 50504]AHL28956.1 hypothetical protein EHEL_080185 [Encephalitozoon hellem ATCC 50504]KAG5860446.1 hypothetical protein KMI_01g00810 [Encephalitozoon hellem]UTX43698.1 hypothetical protein GPU96_08g14670 [Encephalitozoon hellem]WEL39174.1 hypothetical protein PFJ87_08g00320 [Encephalitozoon hellem]
MVSRQATYGLTMLYFLALIGIAVGKSNRILELIVHLPLIFLNFILMMLLISAGQQLYQKNL